MTSIYEHALGSEFKQLHPKMRERFGFSSFDNVAHVGTGVMDEVTRGSAFTVPFLFFGTLRNLLFPEQGTGIPFTVANYAYIDEFGRETVTWHRTFRFDRQHRTLRFDRQHRTRHFDATMIYSKQRRSIVDYLGTHQHVAADLDCWVDDEGGMNFASGEQRCYERRLRFRFPSILTGHASVREWWDEESECYRIRVKVTNPILGQIISYRGSFTNQVIPINTADQIPSEAMPVREQERE